MITLVTFPRKLVGKGYFKVTALIAAFESSAISI